MLKVGLTGNYGMGKSSVLSAFEDLGAVTLDSDRIVGELLKKKDIIAKVRTLLGKEVVDEKGNLIKSSVAKIIFNNNKLRNKLEVLLHPLVMRRIDELVGKIRGKEGIIIVEVPLLFEGKYQGQFDKTITVYTTRKTALERLRDTGVSRKDALMRMKAQMPIQKKKKLADYVIDNNGSKKKTRGQVKKIYGILT